MALHKLNESVNAINENNVWFNDDESNLVSEVIVRIALTFVITYCICNKCSTPCRKPYRQIKTELEMLLRLQKSSSADWESLTSPMAEHRISHPVTLRTLQDIEEIPEPKVKDTPSHTCMTNLHGKVAKSS
jgi:hypothetical protein